MPSNEHCSRLMQIPLCVNIILNSPKQLKCQKKTAYTLHRLRWCTKFPTLPVLVFGVDERWAADLVEVQNVGKYNSGNRYIRVVVNAFSKFAWVQPIKSNTAMPVTEVFSKIWKRADSGKLQTLQTDDGKEFFKRTFQNPMRERHSSFFCHWWYQSQHRRMYHYFMSFNSSRYLNILPAFVKGYNV